MSSHDDHAPLADIWLWRRGLSKYYTSNYIAGTRTAAGHPARANKSYVIYLTVTLGMSAHTHKL